MTNTNGTVKDNCPFEVLRAYPVSLEWSCGMSGQKAPYNVNGNGPYPTSKGKYHAQYQVKVPYPVSRKKEYV